MLCSCKKCSSFYIGLFGSRLHPYGKLEISHQVSFNCIKINMKPVEVCTNYWSHMSARNIQLWCGVTLLIIAVIGSSLPSIAQDGKLLTLQPDSTSGNDAWIFSVEGARDVNFGVWNVQNQGLHNVVRAETWRWADRPDTIRGLINFDLSELPKEAEILDARLSLYFFANTNFTKQVGENAMVIRRIISSWKEAEVTWNNQPLTTNENKVQVARSTSETQDYVDLDVTKLVVDMVKDPDNSFGFMLAMDEEVVFKGLTFASSDHPDAEKHPKLEIRYRLASDVKSNEPTESHCMIDLHPLPGDQSLKLDVNSHLTNRLNLMVVTMEGETVLHHPNLEVMGRQSLPLSFSSLPSGGYIVVADTDSCSHRWRVLHLGSTMLIER